MNVEFHKMHGAKNDFVVFHDLTRSVELTPEQVAKLCDRREGIGADGVIIVRNSDIADFFMDYINSDGTIAEMCGNGIRCLGKYVYDNALTSKKNLKVETRAGIKPLSLIIGDNGKVDRVKVNMGAPIFDPYKIPVNISDRNGPILDYPVEVAHHKFYCNLVSMGNPHCVIFAEDNLDYLARTYGPLLETHPVFPSKTNVEFCKVLGPRKLLMRVWERGSGETFACGTGACASAVASVLKGFTKGETTVELLGGPLSILWKGNNNSVIMTGKSETVYIGSITL
ncbi:MAG: diaminopimelate epimerase [Syntrophaceae bacterium]|nr:diaminopimelate epimerase [Syntrophaceae bacterium]